MRTLLSLFLLVLSAGAAWAQAGNVYVFVAPGALSCCGGSLATIQGGVGGEVSVWKRLAAGAEIGALGPVENIGSGFGVASFNGYGHLLGSGRKLDPFVTGGYSLLWSNGHANAGNVGAGLNYWFARHFGLRVEGRDHIRNQGQQVHYWGVRFGIAIH